MTYAEAIDARARLSVLAQELGARSGDLAHVSRELEATDEAYRAYVDEYEAMDPALLGRHKGLCASRDRLKQRIADLKAEIEAQRSILSALKTEMEATG
jgi:chromosome segregation ATPase